MEYYKLTNSQFADSIEVPRAILSHIMSGRNKPSLDVIIKVIGKYRQINLNWLLLGEGEMLKEIVKADVQPEAKIADQTHTLSPLFEPADKETEPVKIQNPKLPVFPDLTSLNSNKQVKQIVFFYTDNSFSVFNPEV